LQQVVYGKADAWIVGIGKVMPIARNLKNENRRLHLVSIPYDKRLRDLYVPSDFSSDEYPNLIAAGETVETVAASVLLVALNLPEKTERYQRVERNSGMHCFPGLTNCRNRRATRNGRRRALLRSYLGGSGFKAAQDWLEPLA
jgi:hypothetical protein